MNQKIVPVISVTMGIFAFFLTHQYIRGKLTEVDREWIRLRQAHEKVVVMVATHDIPVGTKIMSSDVTTNLVYKTLLPSGAVLFQYGREILQRKTVAPLTRGDIVSWADIEGGAVHTGLAPVIKPGMRAISLSVGGAAAVSGMVQPNDRVDILGTFSFPSKTTPGEMETVTLTILQNVTVLATGQRLAKQVALDRAGGRQSAYSTVTVEVSLAEAELLVFAEQMKGRLVLALRNPSDVNIVNEVQRVNFEYLEQTIPQLNARRQALQKKTNY